MPTPTPPAGQVLLHLLWLASPTLPVGAFSYSEGLEAAVEAGLVHDEFSTADWLSDQMTIVLARSEIPVLAGAFDAWRAEPVDECSLRELNTWHLCTRETAEMRMQAQQMGRSMREWLRALAPGDARLHLLAALEPAPTWPVAYALALARTGATRHESALTFAFSWVEAAVQAALRVVPLGQNAGQRVLARLADLLPGQVEAALERTRSRRQSFAPGLALLSSGHEVQYSRLFRS